MFHYTDKLCWNAIRSQFDWLFKANQPPAPERPKGVYFTSLEPSRINLRLLHKRIRIPKDKQEYIFWFEGVDGLIQLNEGTGRDKSIFYSEEDYLVVRDRQKFHGLTENLSEQFL